MSMAIAHFSLGVIATALLFTATFPRAVQSPSIIIAGGVWAVVPDIHWVMPVGSSLVRSFHGSVWANLFWFHRVADIADPLNSRTLAAGTVLLMLAVTPLCERIVAMEMSERSITASEERG